MSVITLSEFGRGQCAKMTSTPWDVSFLARGLNSEKVDGMFACRGAVGVVVGLGICGFVVRVVDGVVCSDLQCALCGSLVDGWDIHQSDRLVLVEF